MQTETQSQIQLQRLRLCYEKGESIKFISHQDEFRLWERTLRRADLPLLYSQGFNPQPQIQFASPLGVGITGRNELVDITLSEQMALPELAQRIRARLPPGVALHDLEEIPVKSAALQSTLIGADYTILLYAAPGELQPAHVAARIAHFLQQPESWRERERKGQKYIYNLRPLVFELHYRGYDAEQEEHTIFLRVQQRSGATGRPDEVVAALGFDDFARTLRRERLYFAHIPEDSALFDTYPEISQQAIAHPDNVKPARRRGRRTRHVHKSPGKTGRAINERAGDEFV